MERLTGMDAAFFHMETPDMHMHVMGTIIVDPSTMAGGYSFETIKDTVASRIHLIPPFRRRLVEIPFRLGHPVWIEDSDFDLDAHIHRVAVPAPHSLKELAEIVADLASRPLDHNRPLWDMWVIEGLEGGHIALSTKIHHSAIDGVTGADLMVHLFDLTPEVAEVEAPEELPIETRPTDVQLVLDAALVSLRQPLGMARQMNKATRGLVAAVQ